MLLVTWVSDIYEDATVRHRSIFETNIDNRPEMEPIPLIPKSTIKSNHDTSHVIRQSFQDVFARSRYPDNVMQNMSKFAVEFDELKCNAIFARYGKMEYEDQSNSISEVEKELMENHGIYLIGKEVLAKDKAMTENLQLKRYSLLPEIGQQRAEKYDLIKQEKLFLSAAERSVDFALNSNRHRCTTNCLQSDAIVHDPGIQVSGRSSDSSESIKTQTKEEARIIFEAIPKRISFRNYMLNCTYKKTLKLRNVSTSTNAVMLKSRPKSPSFRVDLASPSCRVAAGMCVVFAVRYETDVHRDARETLRFATCAGRDVVVELESRGAAPNLRVYVFKTGPARPDAAYGDCPSGSGFDVDRTMALNSSVDCGHALVGREVKISLIVKNEGRRGKFFFLSEPDWYHYSLLNVTSSMELLVGPFKLYPAYFEVDESEFVEIVISFFPKQYGLFVETINMLCSNNMCEELDMIGDGVYFEKSFITFDLKPKQFKPFFLDYESQYCVHLGKALGRQITTASLKVNNTSALNLIYRWAVRKSVHPGYSDFKHLAPHWVKIEERCRFIPYYSSKEFSITVNPETTIPGLYHIVLCLYIENIPELSLRNRKEFTVIEKSDSESELKLLDVLVGEIELLIDVERIEVLIVPNPLIIPFRPQMIGKYTETITIIPQTCHNLRCQWKHHKRNTFTAIEPRVFEMDNKNVQCTITVENPNVGNTDEQYLLWINDGIFRRYFHVMISKAGPAVSFNPAMLVFGDLMANFHCEQTTTITNHGDEDVKWNITEEILDPKSNLMIVDAKSGQVIPHTGTLKSGESQKLKFIPNTTIFGEKTSYLKIFTQFTSNGQFDALCNVHYNVCKPKLIVHTNTSVLPILCPSDVLFVGIATHHHICVHNVGNIMGILLWGNPTGPSAENFDIAIAPQVGIVGPQESIHIDLTVTPKSMGYFEDVYIPLFAVGIDNVILVKVMCLVSDITVNVYIPDVVDEYYAILWPKIIEELNDEVYNAENAPEEEQIKEKPHPGEEEPMPASVTSEYHRDDTSKCVEEMHLDTATDALESAVVIATDSKETEVKSPNYVHGESKQATATKTTGPKRSIRDFTVSCFKDDLSLQKYCIEFQSVPLRTPIKKNIKIENLTPGKCQVSVEVVSFYPINERNNIVNDVMAKLKIAKSTAWDDIVTSDGIVIKIEQPRKQLDPFEIIEFDIWVYATTWGYYVDELIVDVSQVIPFTASLLIEVIGHPIEYPIAQNSITLEPTLRLGVLSYKSDDVNRRVKVVNTSVCPVYIAWQIFVNSEHDPTQSFSVLLDLPFSDEVCNDESDIKPKFIVADEYYGQTNANYFEINPCLSMIPPGGFAYVHIRMNVSNFEDHVLNKSLFAYLVGIIKIPCECRKQPHMFVRPHGIDIGCTKVKITFKVELPTVVVDDFPQKLQLSVYANDILDNETYEMTQRLLLKNTTRTQAFVYLEIEKPFRIVSVTTPYLKVEELKRSIPLHPEDTAEVKIKCVLAKEDILQIVDNLRLGTNTMPFLIVDFAENSLKICKKLSVYQREYLQKTIPVELKVFFPIFRAKPVHVQFGMVFIGNTSKQIVTLRNLTGVPLNFEIFKMSKYPEVIISPERGTIPKLNDGTEFVLSIFFTPTEPKAYLLWFAVETALPHHFIVFNVLGVGSYDENYYKPGLH